MAPLTSEWVTLYSGLTVRDHLRLGAELNPAWDETGARARIDRVGLDLGRRTGGLFGGQRARLAVAVAIGKRPELLILDEPVASLDPLVRDRVRERPVIWVERAPRLGCVDAYPRRRRADHLHQPIRVR